MEVVEFVEVVEVEKIERKKGDRCGPSVGWFI